MKLFVCLFSSILSLSIYAQEKPEPIPKEELPPSAVCAYCVALGTMMTPSKPESGVRYRGKRYFFHDDSMRKAFMKDPDAYADPVIPRPAPLLDLSSSIGARFDNKMFLNQVVLVDFWASWCGPCRKMFPVLDSIYAEEHANGLEILSIGEDLDRKEYDKFLKANPFTHPVAFDDKKAFAAWHVIVLPAIFLIKDGRVVAQWVGVTEQQTIQDEVKKALAKG
jgi:thiol-disulfide isomerase/thioredoxin